MNQKWLAIIGSPKKNGNTDKLVDIMSKNLFEYGIDVEKYHIDPLNLNTCTGCAACTKTDKCIIEDEMGGVISKMHSYDGYIFASPSYNYNLTASMKAFLDRTMVLNHYNANGWFKSDVQGKKAFIVGNCGGPEKKHMGFTVESIKVAIEDLEIVVLDRIEYYNAKNDDIDLNRDFQNKIKTIVKNNMEI